MKKLLLATCSVITILGGASLLSPPDVGAQAGDYAGCYSSMGCRVVDCQCTPIYDENGVRTGQFCTWTEVCGP